jgi:hypothetical protein
VTRDEAMALARTGAPLNSKELMLILQLKPSWFYASAKAGRYDQLKCSSPIGSRIYSGTLICRWMDGQSLPHPFARLAQG